MDKFRKIGTVRNGFNEPTDPFEMRKHESEIIIKEEYVQGLYRIEASQYLQVVFYFHKSKEFRLVGPRYDGEVTGVFASRSPKRPSPIGITTVKLIACNGNRLLVSGLDALNGSPVLDLKPYAPGLDEASWEKLVREKEFADPRSEIKRMVKTGELERLLLKAGSLHGHICPGLSLGVIAGAYGLKEFGLDNDGMEGLLAIVETNNCFTDGIQYISGCTLGNNALIYRDYGKTAVTFTCRDGRGLRLIVRPDFKQLQKERFPEFAALFQKVVTEREGTDLERVKFRQSAAETGIALVEVPVEKIFKIEMVQTELPKYAPIHGDACCKRCRESVISSRIVSLNGEQLCMACAKGEYYELTGWGIHRRND